MAGRMGARLMAIVTEGDRGRVYLDPTREMEAIANGAKPEWKPDESMNRDTPNLVLYFINSVTYSMRLVGIR